MSFYADSCSHATVNTTGIGSLLQLNNAKGFHSTVGSFHNSYHSQSASVIPFHTIIPSPNQTTTAYQKRVTHLPQKSKFRQRIKTEQSASETFQSAAVVNEVITNAENDTSDEPIDAIAPGPSTAPSPIDENQAKGTSFKRRPLCPALEEARNKIALLEALYLELAGAAEDESDSEEGRSSLSSKESVAHPHASNLVGSGDVAVDGLHSTFPPAEIEDHNLREDDFPVNSIAEGRRRKKSKHSAINDFEVQLENMLRPIISSLGQVVAKEEGRREAVLSEMDNLEGDIATAADLLGESCASYVNDNTVPPLASVYKRRDALLAIKSQLDDIVHERKMTMEHLYETAGLIRREVGDLQDEEFSLAMCKDYSTETMAKAAHVVQELELEKRIRFDQLCELVSSLHTLLLTLNIPPATEYDLVIATLFPDSTAEHPPTIEDAKRALTSPTPQSSPSKSSNASDSSYTHHSRYALPRLLTLSRHCAQALRERKEGVLAEWERRRGLVRGVVREIGMFWDELGVDESERVDLKEDVEMLDKYLQLAEELRVRWREEMEAKVDGLLGQLGELWDKCRVSDQDQSDFMCSLKTNLYSPLTVELLLEEISRLTARYEKYGTILEKIQEREDLLKKMREFEKTASDPRRLFRSSFQLLEEEKFRKTCFPTLMRIENSLRRDVASFEAENGPGAIVEWKGERFLDLLEREVSERFINDTVFVIGPAHAQKLQQNGSAESDMLSETGRDRADSDTAVPPSTPKLEHSLKRSPSKSSIRSMPGRNNGGGTGISNVRGGAASTPKSRPVSAATPRKGGAGGEVGSVRKSASVGDLRRSAKAGGGEDAKKVRKSAEMSMAGETPRASGRTGVNGTGGMVGTGAGVDGSSARKDTKGGVVGRLARKGSSLFGMGQGKEKEKQTEDGKGERNASIKKENERARSGSGSSSARVNGKANVAGK
ncbi:carboxypeptidase C prc1 [Rhizophlyctis rosea]|nr:carboxypeptidase C prc1 [Rhizophlyctis rosea]